MQIYLKIIFNSHEILFLRHLLSDQTDPFNRSPLTMNMVVPNVELRNKIQEWIAQKKQEKASTSDTSTQQWLSIEWKCAEKFPRWKIYKVYLFQYIFRQFCYGECKRWDTFEFLFSLQSINVQLNVNRCKNRSSGNKYCYDFIRGSWENDTKKVRLFSIHCGAYLNHVEAVFSR